jgi:hypothetical protein
LSGFGLVSFAKEFFKENKIKNKVTISLNIRILNHSENLLEINYNFVNKV